jgi:hypothetical protein
MNEPKPLHRLFCLAWMDLLDGTDVTVEMEFDLSHRHQFLDLLNSPYQDHFQTALTTWPPTT